MADDLFADIPVEKQADALFADLPTDKRRAGVRAALVDLMQQRAAVRRHKTKKGGTSEDADAQAARQLNAATLGGLTQLEGALGAGITAAQRAVPGGKDPKFTARDMYDATRLLRDAEQKRFAGRHPVVAGVTDVVGALQMPGAATVGKWVVGKTAPKIAATGAKVPKTVRAGQTLRAATAGGALTGAQAGALAPPGEEIERAKSAAVTGAVLAPVAGVAADVAMRAAPAATRLAKSVVGKGPSAEITSIEKLQKALRQAGVTPDAINAASDEWATMGGVTPALIDLVKDSGGSPEVLRLLARSSAKAPQRQIAERYAEDVVGGTQREALEQVKVLPTGGETRTPTQIREGLTAERARIAAEQEAGSRRTLRRGDTRSTTIAQRGNKRLSQIDVSEADRLAKIEADRIAETPEVPGAPRPRETGAAAFADDINRRYDVSEKTYKDAYAAAEAAKPEAAVIEDTEVRPLFAKLQVPQTFDEALPGVAAVKKYLASKQNMIAPGDASDWPGGEVMELATPLTMLELQKMRQVLTHYASKYADEPGGALAGRLKMTLDQEIDRLAAENKISGDPEIVDKWKTAIGGAREHFSKFGSGLPAKLTARNPDGSRAVPSHQAGDVIFGSPGQLSLNKSLTELEGSLDLASPEAVRALQEELYGRVTVADLPKLRETTGGRRLLPEDLTAEALAAREAAQVAETRASEATEATKATAKTLREATARQYETRRAQSDLNTAARESQIASEAARTAKPYETSEAALKLGEDVLTRPTEEFAPAFDAVGATDLPIVASGAKQAVQDVVERPPPDATGALNRLLSARASKNLGLAVGPDDIARMQARIKAITKRGRTAQELEHATGASALHNDPLLEKVSPADIAYPRRGMVDAGLDILMKSRRLNEAEYAAALRALTSKDPAAKAAILDGLLKKYPAAKRAISPFLVRPAAGQGDENAVEALSEEYGVP